MPDQTINGIRCSEVLAALSDFLAGDLPAERREQLQGHVANCAACEQFGADVQRALGLLREYKEPEPLPAQLARRLADVLKDEA